MVLINNLRRAIGGQGDSTAEATDHLDRDTTNTISGDAGQNQAT
jgi:hypothetical protein